MGEICVITASEHPELEDEAEAALRAEWPEFIFHDPVAGALIGRVGEYFPRYDVLLLDDGEVVAGGWGVPQALDLVSIDRERDEGRYEETNLWMRHA